ncbi:MAG: putative cadmium-transporting ATPase, partial [Verrucomicrobiota bacterium]
MSEDGHSHDPGCEHTHDNRFESLSLLASGGLVGAALLASGWKDGSQTVVTLLAGAGMLAGGWFLLPKAWRAIRRLRPDINLLVVIAAVGASIIGEWVEASAVVLLFGVAEWLEGWADRRARRATEALLELAPKIAVVKR